MSGVEMVVTVAKLGWLEGGSLTPPAEGSVGWLPKGGPAFIIPGTAGVDYHRGDYQQIRLHGVTQHLTLTL